MIRDKAELELITTCVLAIIKDYKFADPKWVATKPIRESFQISDSKNLEVEFFDARSQANEYRRILTIALDAWAGYKKLFETELISLPKDDISKFLIVKN